MTLRTLTQALLRMVMKRHHWNVVFEDGKMHCEDMDGNWLDERGNVDPQQQTRIYGGQ